MLNFFDWLQTEGQSYPCIVVDVQPGYCKNSKCEEIIKFINNQTGRVLMFVNAEDQGLTDDTLTSIKEYWEEVIRELTGYDEDEYEHNNLIDWNRFEIVDKGYGYLRSWMDSGIDERIIIATIRELYNQRKSDTRELVFSNDTNQQTEIQKEIIETIERMRSDPLSVNWLSLRQLRRFNGSYIMGGGKNECLREVELMMNAFNIKYKRVQSLVYE